MIGELPAAADVGRQIHMRDFELLPLASNQLDVHARGVQQQANNPLFVDVPGLVGPDDPDRAETLEILV